MPRKASGCSQGEETSGPNRTQAPSQAHQGAAHGASGQRGTEVSEGGGGTCLDSQYFVPTVPQFFYRNNIYIYIYSWYIYVAGLQGWNHVSPDRPLTGLSCEVERAGPGCPGASRGAGSGPAEHCFPSRPASRRPRTRLLGGRPTQGGGSALWPVLVTTSGESKPDSK